MTFCGAKEKQNFFDVERLRISKKKKMETGHKFENFLSLSVPKTPRNYVTICSRYALGQVHEY